VIPGGSRRDKWARLIQDRLFRLSKPWRRVNEDAIHVFGCQKSGTSAVAHLTALAGGLSATVDIPTIWRTPVSAVVKGQLEVEDLIQTHRPYFSRDLVKEPTLAPIMDEVAASIGLRKVVFVIRDPETNVRSRLQRCGLAGDLEDFSADDVQHILKESWHWTYDWPYRYKAQSRFWSGDRHYVEGLGILWCSCVEAMQRATQQGVDVHVVRYEDFERDKQGTVEGILEAFNRPVCQDVSPHLNVRFQPKGNRSISIEAFFGERNLARLNAITASHLGLFGYGQTN